MGRGAPFAAGRLRRGAGFQETGRSAGQRLYAPIPSPPPRRAAIAGGETQHFVKGADIAADWWTLFHSKPLNDLIAQALANNHDLKAAQAALQAASEHTAAQRGAFFPT